MVESALGAGIRARYSSTTFLPDGRLKAVERGNRPLECHGRESERHKTFQTFFAGPANDVRFSNAHVLCHMMKLPGERAPAGLASMLKEELRQCVHGS